MLLNESGYMHDKVAISLTSIFGIAFKERLIYKSLKIIAIFVHFKGDCNLFRNKKEMKWIISVLSVLPLLPTGYDVIDVMPITPRGGWLPLAIEIEGRPFESVVSTAPEHNVVPIVACSAVIHIGKRIAAKESVAIDSRHASRDLDWVKVGAICEKAVEIF